MSDEPTFREALERAHALLNASQEMRERDYAVLFRRRDGLDMTSRRPPDEPLISAGVVEYLEDWYTK